MDRRLAIMRHAKSSWDNPLHSDHQRPLNHRGRRTAPAVGQKLAQLGWIPDVVLCSTAQRTRDTWTFLSAALRQPTHVEFLPELYLPGVDDMQAQLRQLDPAAQTVLLISHNPGCEQLVWRLLHQRIGFKTADVALLQTNSSSWPEAMSSQGHWELVEYLPAREVDPESDD